MMKETVVKKQFCLFGVFNFVPNADTTIELVTAFRAHDMVPSILSVVDVVTGFPQPRISLSRGNDFQIIFGNDRIDVQGRVPDFEVSDHTMSDYATEVSTLLRCLDSMSLQVNRVALVYEFLFDNVAGAVMDSVRRKVVGLSPPSDEWNARWVFHDMARDEPLTIGFEVNRFAGTIIYAGKTEIFDGLRYLIDVSTFHANKNGRFSTDDLQGVLGPILEKISQQEKFARSLGD